MTKLDDDQLSDKSLDKEEEGISRRELITRSAVWLA